MHKEKDGKTTKGRAGAVAAVASGGGGNGFKGGRTRAKSKALLERKEAQKVEDLENKKRAFRKPLWTSGAKVAVTLRLSPLEIVVSREATNALRAFFNEPSSLISSPSHIRHASSSSIHYNYLCIGIEIEKRNRNRKCH